MQGDKGSRGPKGGIGLSGADGIPGTDCTPEQVLDLKVGYTYLTSQPPLPPPPSPTPSHLSFTLSALINSYSTIDCIIGAEDINCFVQTLTNVSRIKLETYRFPLVTMKM